MKKQVAVFALVLVSIAMAGCVTVPLTPEQEEARAKAKIRVAEHLIARVIDITGGGDGAIQLWITDNPKKARYVLEDIDLALGLAEDFGATSDSLRIPRTTLKHFIALFENTTGEIFDLFGAPNGND